MRYKNILVTGAAGFIGFNFVKLALSKRLNVIALDLLTYAAQKDAPEFFKKNNIKFIKEDINKITEKQIRELKIDLIINFAAESHVDNSISSPMIFYQTNVLGTVNLLNIAKNLNIRFHQISTDEVYGDLPLEQKDLKFDIASPLQPSSPYSASKAAGDLAVLAYIKTYKLQATISRCSNNYGPYQNVEKFIPKTIDSILRGKIMGVYGDGKNVRDWIFVDDHNQAVLAIIEKADKGIFNIGASAEKSNLDVFKNIAKIFNVNFKKYIKFVEDRHGHDRRYAIDASSVMKLGWKPKINFEKGLRKTIEFYEKN